MIQRIHLAGICLLLTLVPRVWADLSTALVAYERGDYAAALTELVPLANGGNAKAQFKLGWMCALGRGMPQNDTEALHWYRLAAEQGMHRHVLSLGRCITQESACPKTTKKR